MASGSFTPPRQEFARSAAEETRAKKGGCKQAPTELQPEKPAKTRRKDEAAGRVEAPPASKKAKAKVLPGSSAPSQSAAGTGGSPTSSSYPNRELECCVTPLANPTAEAAEEASINPGQVQGPRGSSGEGSDSDGQDNPAPNDLSEEEEEELEGEDLEEGARFSDTEEPPTEKVDQSPQFFKQEDIQLLINKTISALELHDQADAVEPPSQDKTNSSAKTIKGYPKGKADYFPKDAEGQKFFPVPEYFL
uniref:Uncharacterized protein n=1 Tax=Sphaerodactylus townsendi TaxID=933632 RepID=A0ACB8F4A5_9SAUR